MSDEQKIQIDRLSRALEVSGNTIKSLEKKVANAQQIIALFEQEKKQWTQQKVLQDQIIQQQLAASDGNVRKLESEILDLRAKIKAA